VSAVATERPRQSGFALPKNLRSAITSQEVILLFVIVGLALVIGLFEVLVLKRSEARFLKPQNVLDNILVNASYIAIAAIGEALVIISGNIDISVGSLIGVCATVSGLLAVDAKAAGFPVWIAFVAPVLVGALVGAINGFFVAFLRMPAIVVTLGMLSILQGGLIIATGGKWVYNMPDEFFLALQRPLNIPMPLYFMVILTIVVGLWMRYSPAGRAIYAVGGNKDAARLSGISERRVIMQVFILNGALVGVAALLFATKFSSIQSTVPAQDLINIITAAVIGGVSILGGTGTVFGATLGAILMLSIRSGLNFVNISAYWLQAVQGVLVLVTVLIDLLRRRRQRIE
jgi:ribose/xylose/arabinose/galactoside ABC-type transport system permease subunit